MDGAHFHFYYQQNNHKSVEAKEILRQLTTEEFGLSLDFCPDRNGHEEPHNEVCWLSGPEGKSQLMMSTLIQSCSVSKETTDITVTSFGPRKFNNIGTFAQICL